MATKPDPRLITRKEAAEYCSLNVVSFDRLVRSGLLPRRLPGTKRWDRKAIDIALDKASGLPTQTPVALDVPPEPVHEIVL